jgi:VWFA-related protein
MIFHRSLPRHLMRVGIAVLIAASLHAQSDRQTFRTATDLVRLDVVVLDKQRHPVTGLSAADFSVSLDGQQRPIEAFAPVTLPTRESDAARTTERLPAVAQDVVRNARADDGRLVAILLDRTIPMEAGTRVARSIGRAVVEALGPGDLAAVVRDTGFANDGRQYDFTNDRARLREALDEPFIGLVNPPTMGPGGLVRSEPDLAYTGDCICGLCVLESLERVALAMGEESRRQKLIVFVGSDVVIQSAAGDPCALHLKVARERVFQALDRANVTVHAIDPTGLETMARGADAFPGDQARSAASNLHRQGDLAVFPDYTGGRTVLNTNTPEAPVSAIFDESQSYYLIGIARQNSGDASERRKIRVTIRNHPEFEVRARTGYYAGSAAAKSTLADALYAAVAGLLPKTDIPLRLALTPRFRADGTVVISPLIGLDAASPASALDVLVGVFDDKARPVLSQRQIAQMPDGAAVGPVSLQPIPLKPGHYEIRVGVEPRGTGTTGSVYGAVDVPDLDDGRVALSGVTLQALPAPASGTPLPLEPLLTSPTLRRRFARAEHATAFVQVHVRHADDTPAIRALIRDASGRVVIDIPMSADASALRDTGLADVHVDVPTKDLQPGAYVLTIEATVASDQQRRDVVFEIQ